MLSKCALEQVIVSVQLRTGNEVLEDWVLDDCSELVDTLAINSLLKSFSITL